MGNLPPSSASAHEIGKDPWWVVGFSLIAASDSNYILTYPFLVMSHLGWIPGPVILFLLTVVSFHNNCLWVVFMKLEGSAKFKPVISLATPIVLQCSLQDEVEFRKVYK
ncbi:hypothetical protein BDL97_01G207300 [Sphagnum fallax]|nr:hypothetical protein BDL97_01G207300 [Sphagnum fallax]